MTTTNLNERLASLESLSQMPPGEIAWLAANGTVQTYEAGQTLVRDQDPIDHLNILLSGHIVISFDPGGGARPMAEWRGGEITGLLPFSRMKGSPGRVVSERRTELLQIHRNLFPELIRECPVLTEILVHTMIDRARMFRATELLDEKMVSLGRLAAGLAHELNNPASAVDRTAKSLAGCIVDFDKAARALGSANLAPEQLAAIDRLKNREDLVPPRGRFSSIEVIEREDALSAWMEGHGIESVNLDALAETCIDPAVLDDLTKTLQGDALRTALRYLAALFRARRLAEEIETAASRIHSLVVAVKGFTYMDQATALQPVDIGRGIADTLTVLRSKARQKSVNLNLEVTPELPQIQGYGGELNQVWANLLENAIDAVAPGGHVSVTASHDADFITVRVLDDGPGIPPAIIDRIFEPFFTTKPIGEGTGIGLDTARRIASRHHGGITVQSVPGRTEFTVTLPRSKTSGDAAERSEA